jgi:predicted dithiol-disulfide oxidoreductase (DUF899 family)
MSAERIQELSQQIFDLGQELLQLQKDAPVVEVPDYSFDTLDGDVSLKQLFSGHDKLLAIHNMGQGCRYCTLWADGLNGFLPHLESAMGVVLLSKDDPSTQRRFANARGWRFRLASHGGGDYIREQSVLDGQGNMPGVVAYELREGTVFRKNSAVFGPGDLYCSLWNFIGLAGLDESGFTPQFNYWKRPASLDDGGVNILE